MVVGGTSAVAPLWAGLVALYAQSMGRLVGFLHPKIYASSAMSTGFRDITSGNNDTSGGGGPYSCASGWDAVTGLGAPKGQALLNAIKVAPPTPTPHPTPTPTPHPTPTPTPHPTPTPTPHPTPTPTPHPTPTPTPTPTPDSGGTGAVGPSERVPSFEFPPLPPPVPPPVPAPVAPAPPSIIGGLAGGNSVALVAIVGLGAVMGMVAAAGIVATVAISKDKT